MITKEQYIQSLAKEIDIIIHLAEKVTPDMLEYRPHEKQRSTLELMQYLGQIFAVAVEGFSRGSQEAFMELFKNVEPVTAENFIEKMKEQSSFVSQKIASLREEELNTESTMFGTTATLSMHLLSVLKWAAAYKMQLFLYIKATGNHAIGTSNLWGGIDTPPKE